MRLLAYIVLAAAIRNGDVIDLPRVWELRGAPAETLLRRDRVPAAWNGEGRFSLPLEIPPELVGLPLALEIDSVGAAEIFLDGRRLASRAHDTSLIPLRLDRAGRHDLTVHYKNPLDRALWRAGWHAGFFARLGLADAVSRAAIERTRAAAFPVWFFTAVFLAFALLHFCHWVFQRDATDHLWFSGLCLTNGVLSFLLFYKSLTRDPRFMLVSEPAMNIFGLLFGLFALRFVYGLFPRNYAKRVLQVLSVLSVLLALWSLIDTGTALPFVFLFMLSSCLELARVVLTARGARVIGIGVLTLALGFGLALLRNLGILSPALLPAGNYIAFASMVVLIATMSLYLSREFARASRYLRRQLIEIARLSEEKLEHERREAEYRRKTEEMEEARALQMSMLPREVPSLEQLEIAAWMATASEVGGDYYDFVISRDALLLGIGDATGHGMRAGTMVTAIKALFGELRGDDLARELSKTSRSLRRMNMRRVAMSLTLARFDASGLLLAAAGMPPVYIRRADGRVEGVDLPGSPLGTVDFPYRQLEVHINRGDFVVFMTDGLPELQSESGEMVGYDRVISQLQRSVAKTAQELVSELVAFGESWRGARPQDDDMTFVAVRVK
ncbi:MAG TPA: PP2C family protein-serine/threonine phosphatase [Thermoanaerobaculia bacterium]|nr:PP2C family protein-serine/threonine phosphatase [Thermoanaerobaculia bacterium]